MRIQSVRVDDLFHSFSYRVPLNLDARITIIHAPNGFGKTTLLRLIDGLFNSQTSVFRTCPFREFEVTFTNTTRLLVTKTETPAESHPERGVSSRIEVRYFDQKPEHKPFHLNGGPLTKDLDFPLSIIEEHVPGLVRVSHAMWRSTGGEMLDIEGVLDRYAEYLPMRPRRKQETPEWWRELCDQVKVRFIGTDRLQSFMPLPSRMRRESPVPMPTVLSYSGDLAKRIESTLAKYGELSQSLDRSFPTRLIQGPPSVSLTKEQITEKLDSFEKKRATLIDAGLLEPEPAPVLVALAIEEQKQLALSIYVDDVEKKLAVLDVLAEKIDLFRSVINQRFQYKQMRISKDRGFYFVTATDHALDASSLSSGEQHEVVLLYELLFHTRTDSLILIDEPEISLHVAWQQQFLHDLLKMTELSKFDVLLATHSPLIIDDRWDLTVELGAVQK
jgi:ABC-type transport system involved in cytochrome c biogenesis ATPase subunit